ncbi:hypothetical protein SISSUDRAFT_529339 [Sistotremastrum suecicum HHB10207 ss-3]|uniref:Uncharacterized protein n=1 Tax=Sistotremastrum suecicum HHB10207 ss-3 TaxID=1314776 RepID=A0A165XTU4_9AGAM|nr:hypothetical protein SISSUDRAFT_529339 [Sistotremastrum suecicum HHB10207 ss-3]
MWAMISTIVCLGVDTRAKAYSYLIPSEYTPKMCARTVHRPVERPGAPLSSMRLTGVRVRVAFKSGGLLSEVRSPLVKSIDSARKYENSLNE